MEFPIILERSKCANLIGKVVELIRTVSNHSIRSLSQTRAESKQSTALMSGLSNSLLTEFKIELDWSKELAECLSSSDMRNRHMLEFMLVYSEYIV